MIWFLLVLSLCRAQLEAPRDSVLSVFSYPTVNAVQLVTRGLEDAGFSVTPFNATTAVPTMAQMRNVSTVFVWVDVYCRNGSVLGDALADFVNQGGHVVVSAPAMTIGYDLNNRSNGGNLRGRFLSAGMSPIPVCDAARDQDVHNLTKVLDTHRLLSGVSMFSGGKYDQRPLTLRVESGAILVANWSSGEPMIAVFPKKFPGTIVALGFWPVQYYWTGDGMQMIANALRFSTPLVAAGQPCMSKRVPCAADFVCVNGTCCESACDGACQACSAAGTCDKLSGCGETTKMATTESAPDPDTTTSVPAQTTSSMSTGATLLTSGCLHVMMLFVFS